MAESWGTAEKSTFHYATAHNMAASTKDIQLYTKFPIGAPGL